MKEVILYCITVRKLRLSQYDLSTQYSKVFCLRRDLNQSAVLLMCMTNTLIHYGDKPNLSDSEMTKIFCFKTKLKAACRYVSGRCFTLFNGQNVV